MVGKISLKQVIFLLFVLAILLRLPGLGMAPYSDEVIQMDIQHDDLSYLTKTSIHLHPPMTFLLTNTITYLFGVQIWVMRLIPLIFMMINSFLVYIIARQIYDRRVAFISLLFMLFAFYPIVASLQIEVDSVLMLLFLLTFYFLFRFEESQKQKWLFFIGISIGLILLTRYQGIVIFPILICYHLVRYRNIISSFKLFSIVAGIAALVFSVFPLFSYMTNPNIFLKTIENIFIFAGDTRPDVFPYGFSIIFLYLWATPLLLGLAALSIIKSDKRDYAFFSWIIFVVLFYTFGVRFGDFPRYYINIIPPLVILSAKVFGQIQIKKKEGLILLISGVFSFIFFLLLNLFIRDYPRKIMSHFFTLIKNLDLNFFFPYSVGHGTWTGMNFLSIVLMTFVSFALFIGAFVYMIRKSKIARVFFILFIGVGIGFNSVLAGEYLFHVTTPDPSKVVYEMVNYFQAEKLSFPVYTSNKGISYLVDDQYRESKNNFRIGDFSQLQHSVNNFGGTILFLDFATYFTVDEIKNIEGCYLIQEFWSNDFPMGYVFSCRPSLNEDI